MRSFYGCCEWFEMKRYFFGLHLTTQANQRTVSDDRSTTNNCSCALYACLCECPRVSAVEIFTSNLSNWSNRYTVVCTTSTCIGGSYSRRMRWIFLWQNLWLSPKLPELGTSSLCEFQVSLLLYGKCEYLFNHFTAEFLHTFTLLHVQSRPSNMPTTRCKVCNFMVEWITVVDYVYLAIQMDVPCGVFAPAAMHLCANVHNLPDSSENYLKVTSLERLSTRSEHSLWQGPSQNTILKECTSR